MRSTAVPTSKVKNKGGALAELALPLFFYDAMLGRGTHEHLITCWGDEFGEERSGGLGGL